MIVTKNGPFNNEQVKENYPLIAKLLNQIMSSVDKLPDFSNDSKVIILSDFGGEHKGANFKTYSFLFCSGDKRGVLETHLSNIRAMHGMNEPWKEYSYKKIKYGPIKRSVESYFNAVDKFTHGLLLTISIDNNIYSLFCNREKESIDNFLGAISERGMGEWGFKEAEKVMRVCHIIGYIMSIIGVESQKILWMCDHDTINVDAKKRTFEDTQKILLNCLGVYSKNYYEIMGFAKPFKQDASFSDLLSICDFAAGITQDLLSHALKNGPDEIDDEKLNVVNWISSKSNFLVKLNLVLQESKGSYSMNFVNYERKN